MKILLDENIPRQCKRDFPNEHTVVTVNEAGWDGVKNGELLRRISENGYDVFVTTDKNLQHQQNLSKYVFKVIVLRARHNKYSYLKPLMPSLITSLSKSEKLVILGE
jgi:predicted nuclease of predicted toxin-antitoxin system